MNGTNNFYNGNDFNNQNLNIQNFNNVNGGYNQYPNQQTTQLPVNNGNKKKMGIGTLVLVLLLIVCIGGLLQATGVIDVTTIFGEKTSQKDDTDKKDNNDNSGETTKNESVDSVEKTDKDTQKDRLVKLCQTYTGKLSNDEIYLNGRVVSGDDEKAGKELLGENGMFNPGEVCMSYDGDLNCLIIDDKYYYGYACNINEYTVLTHSEVKANLLISTACSQIDNNGNYTNSENNLTCSNFTCSVTVDGNNYSKSCR